MKVEEHKNKLYSKIKKLDEEIIRVEKPSEAHTILMMNHSSICGELRGIEFMEDLKNA